MALVSITVHDRGEGLTRLNRVMVFEKFYRARNDGLGVQGSGMGWPSPRRSSRPTAGPSALRVNSVQGSRFTMSLAVAKAPAEAEHQQA